MRVKSALKSVFRAMKSSVFITVVGLLALALLIWFGGPLLAIAGYEPLASATARLVTLLVIALIWGGSHYIKGLRESRSHKQAVDTLLNGEEHQQHDELARRDIEVLRERMQKALDILKHARFSKARDIYQLPWYMLIGPPGSGKTTTLYNSGLEFPLKEHMGTDAIEGIGGTRQCDWWFTNQAVLIDTAGRYTTQDSHAGQDSTAWQGFLGLLRKNRPRRPINGVIVFVSLADLLNQTRTERNLHARAIKQRVQELQNQLGMTFPVYVMFTKADLIAGFTEYFDNLSEEEREQVWGMTFDASQDDNDKGVVAQFNKEFHAIINRLTQRLYSRLQFEHDLENRAAIFEFPRQLRLLQSAADDFLKEIFAPNPFEKATMLRGVYIASATQEGVPIDRIMSQLGANFGLAEPPLRRQTGEGKGYFIKRFFEEIVIPERELASVNMQHKTRHRWIRRGALASTAIAATWLLVAWAGSYNWNTELVDEVAGSINAYEKMTASGRQNDDIVVLNEQLNLLRDLPAGYSGVLPTDGPKNLGLYQGDKLGQAAKTAYQYGLYHSFVPYLLQSLTAEMQLNAQHRDYLYETLKTYLMLFQPEQFDIEQVSSWFALYVERQFPSEVNLPLRLSLQNHLQALLESGVKGAHYDESAVIAARELLLTVPLAERAYQRIRTELVKSHIPDFRLIDVLGTDGVKVVQRKSGAPLQQGIPGLYTYKGFHGLFNVEKRRIIKILMEDGWVYGEQNDEGVVSTDSSLSDKVTEKYLRDYAYLWQELLDDITISKVTNVEQGVFVTKVLSGPEQPVQNIIRAVQQNVRLTSLPESAQANMAKDVAGKVAETQFSSQTTRITRLLPDDMSALSEQLPGKYVERAFSDVLNISEAKLEQIAQTSGMYHDYLERLFIPGGMARQAYVNQLNGEGGNELSVALRRLKSDIPAPFSDWLGELSVNTSELFAKGSRQFINEAWQGTVLAEYKQALAGRYPLNRRSDKDIKLRDFERFFGYDGTLDSFFKEYLQSFVNTSRSNWTFKKDIGLDQSVLQTFQRAAQIRAAFFEDGSQKLKVGFSLKPVYLDRHITHLLLELDGQELSYRHGPTRSKQFFWPGDRNKLETRLVFTPANSGLSSNISEKGEWSWFRLLDQLAQSRPQTRTDRILHLAVQGNKARVELVPDTVNNPFWNNALETFSCPASL
ncbi:type VI secretion system membrane subunit TssM [Rheinheimera maricola]|uniref:Type VI secretion system membrane subunit TssM n=1 Tax=Rheinheimera maricola TaxID=2793282 RepID=A0ABS7X7X9_9GAMM|nr:type VI secretion system membrane subunit TssM [Rheinheimera maricola]MBZ9610902.1 type VI secretion system membrane subunit TssM [Rheinheimera maricola]